MFFKSLLGKDEPVLSYKDFWTWFHKNEKPFFQVVKRQGNIEKDFFDKVNPKLGQIMDGMFLLTGMYNDTTAELVFTPDGNIRKIVLAEELVASAPEIEGWRFTALKPAMDRESFGIHMGDFKVTDENLEFFANESWERPDEIDITVVHKDLNDDNRDALTNAIYIFLDNYLGELSFATTIDNLRVVGLTETEKEPTSIKELKMYLAQRQSKFVEKYEGVRFNTDDDAFTMMEAELESGSPLIAVINTTLLMWDRKPSHSWIAGVEITYTDSENLGLPGEKTYQLLGDIEDEILTELKDFEGYLNIGRETAKNVRTVYFACRDFRKPSKVFDRIKLKYADKVELDFNIYKDKYWQSFDRFLPAENTEFAN